MKLKRALCPESVINDAVKQMLDGAGVVERALRSSASQTMDLDKMITMGRMAASVLIIYKHAGRIGYTNERNLSVHRERS